MSHLGERLSALIDGELGHAERERALSHLAGCEACRCEAEMLRHLKRRLYGMHAPEPPLDFMGRLSEVTRADPGLAEPPPLPSRGFLSGLWRRGREGGGGSESPSPGEAGPPPEPWSRSGGAIGRAFAEGPGNAGPGLLRGGMQPRYAFFGLSLMVLALGTAFLGTAGEQEEDPAPIAHQESAEREPPALPVSIEVPWAQEREDTAVQPVLWPVLYFPER